MNTAAMGVEDQFYANLPAFDRFEDIAEAAVYQRVPDSWHVLITDVKGSTRAIEAGRYKDVNALGVSTITAVVNQLNDVPFPYVFGGDGATLLIPPSRRDQAVLAARNAIRLATEAFDLELRAGIVPVKDLAAAGVEVRVAKFRVSPNVCLGMFEGGGLAQAEKLVKDPQRGAAYALTPVEVPDESLFQGFECRWKPIPARKDRVLCLLVVARAHDAAAQRLVYRRVLDGIAAAAHMGMDGLRPVDGQSLQLGVGAAGLRVEASVRSGHASGPRFLAFRLRAQLLVLLARTLMRFGIRLGGFDGSFYKRDVAANTDFRKFDDTLRMVLDVSEAELRAILVYLEGERLAGEVAYGTHASDAALMTCFVQDYAGNHIHFVDGSNGGYALAAKQLKEQLRAPAGAVTTGGPGVVQ
ncbi:MAG: DUF3095 domain-containing protein [Deltaproteobacteria bacterium]|nr:DUF3095 domain-containing protein [Deltaproteobacteria bacterium]